MKKRLNIEIECGETTCAAEPGKFCQYLQTWRAQAVCALFPSLQKPGGQLVGGWADRDMHTELVSTSLGVQRCPACIAAETDPAEKLIEALSADGNCPDFLGIAECADRAAGECPAADVQRDTPECKAVTRACWDKWAKGELK